MNWKSILNLIFSGLGWAKKEGLYDKGQGPTPGTPERYSTPKDPRWGPK